MMQVSQEQGGKSQAVSSIQNQQALKYLVFFIFISLAFYLFLLFRKVIVVTSAERLAHTLSAKAVDMPSTTLIVVIVLLAGVALGVLVGMPLGFHSLTYFVKKEMRRRLERAKYNEEPINFLCDSRSEKRDEAEKFYASLREQGKKVSRMLVDIKAPVLDAAGVALENEEATITADLLNISHNGVAVLSKYFLPIGLDVRISCKGEKTGFEYRRAEVRYVIFQKQGFQAGLQIGLQFFEPLQHIV